MLISNNINRNYNIYNTKPSYGVRFSAFGLQADTVSFTASKPNSIENRMKSISGLHDPYSEIVMVSDGEYARYMNKVEKRPTAQTVLNLLQNYDENLFGPEKEIRNILADGLNDYKKIDPKNASKIDLHDLLNKYYLGAKVSLAQKQINVLNNVKEIVSETNGQTKERLTEIFEPVEETIYDDSFRINPLLQKVRSIKGIDKKAKKMVLKEMDNFPNSRNCADVFIVTNSHKSHKEIAEAFITPSRVSIEHIRPQSRGGASNVNNYIVASKRMNSIRSSMPLDKFIRRNPNIPNCMERYFNDIVDKVNQGGLTYMTMSLPNVMKTIEHESNGIVQLELGEITLAETMNAKRLRKQLDDLVEKFCK